MASITINFTDEEKKFAENLAEFDGVDIQTYFRQLLNEKIEDYEDEQVIKEMEKDMIENPEDYSETYTLDEVRKELGI